MPSCLNHELVLYHLKLVIPFIIQKFPENRPRMSLFKQFVRVADEESFHRGSFLTNNFKEEVNLSDYPLGVFLRIAS